MMRWEVGREVEFPVWFSPNADLLRGGGLTSSILTPVRRNGDA